MLTKTIGIDELMAQSGVKFGTSGARGRVSDLTDEVCYAYTQAFLQHLAEHDGLQAGSPVAIGGDLRESTPRIMEAVFRAASDSGYPVINCGLLPSPALAWYATEHAIPGLMVTGSHIPDDRNGIKFYKPVGEILKPDEAAIKAQTVGLPVDLFDQRGAFTRQRALPPVNRSAVHGYIKRYLDFFPPGCLKGAKVGVYEHSTVAREVLAGLLERLGAEVTCLGRSDTFVPLDTEAIRPEDVRRARQWCAGGRFDCIVSADGDGDRPLISDEKGNWLRGDLAGILCARYLGAQTVATPVSCNTAVEASGWFKRVFRTRIGSPYVIETMNEASRHAPAPVVGYEANGGFLIATEIRTHHAGRVLSPLPTRDAAIVAIAVLARARMHGVTLSALMEDLPERYTHSDRLQAFPPELSHSWLREFSGPSREVATRKVEAYFGGRFGAVSGIDTTDGVRITFADGRIAHLRASGNAPELRCYSEAESPFEAQRMADTCLRIVEGWRKG